VTPVTDRNGLRARGHERPQRRDSLTIAKGAVAVHQLLLQRSPALDFGGPADLRGGQAEGLVLREPKRAHVRGEFACHFDEVEQEAVVEVASCRLSISTA